jgi:AcrR family transcriptional regulator
VKGLVIDGLRERKRTRTRAVTVNVALGLFAARGYDAVTVAEICAAAEIAPRTFFRYFPTKEDVLAEPARNMGARIENSIAATPVGIDDAETLRLAFRALGEYLVANRQELTNFFRVATETSALRSSPLLRLSDRERDVAQCLARRRPTAGPPSWQSRLLVARASAAFRVWLDDYIASAEADPLLHLDEVLAMR